MRFNLIAPLLALAGLVHRPTASNESRYVIRRSPAGPPRTACTERPVMRLWPGTGPANTARPYHEAGLNDWQRRFYVERAAERRRRRAARPGASHYARGNPLLALA